MKTIIYLVRHGEVHNPDKIFYGRIPGFMLSETGRKQARDLGKFLSGKKISAIYSSPLERTRETASFIASFHDVPVLYDERLLEVHSLTQGRLITELALERWDFYQPKFTKSGGETLRDVWKRMDRFFREAVKKHKGQEIVVVSHGDPVMISAIKHRGRPLRLAEIRGQEYVQTARGFSIIFEEFRATRVTKLDF
jgi:broad specificity phosphatase PhoE